MEMIKWPLWLILLTSSISCANAQSVRYLVRFSAPLSHYAEVEATIPTEGKPSLEVMMPVWTPGSYLVREYARNVEQITAADPSGKSLPIEKTRKNRWQIQTGGAADVVLQYRLYCHELSVRTNWIDENFALLNGAATFITDPANLTRDHDVQIELPAAWKTSISGMEQTASNQFRAPDYDTLVDSPILAGNPAIHPFEVAGIPHFLVNQGETLLWDGNRAAQDTKKIVEQNLKLWGSLPYKKYVFLNLILDSGGGLEHKNSQTIMTSRYQTRTRKGYLGFLGLVSHEYFHAWNVKRLRPVELGPFDYENENYTRDLWVAEGFTDYYGGLNVRRAGLASDAEYIGTGSPADLWGNSLTLQIETLQKNPGRLVQSLAMASYDAWIKAYRPDENSGNTTVSYYTKGAIVAWLLDTRIRVASAGSKSLDDLMRLVYSRFSGAHGYTTDDFINAASEIAGTELNNWFQKVLYTHEDLSYSEPLSWFGLEFKKPDTPKSDNRPKASSGMETTANSGHLSVTQVPQGTPGQQAGFSVGDEILAIDNWRLPADGLAQRLEQYAPDDTVDVLVSRRDRILHVTLKLGEEPAQRWQLMISAHPTPAQTAHLTAWLTR